jgi:hypothetical protein
MTYSLRRTRDGAGDSGNMSVAYHDPDGESEPVVEHDARPRVGVVMRVGSYTARSFDPQDWWQTTPVTEIVEDYVDDEGDQWVRFKTKNSEYIWKEF